MATEWAPFLGGEDFDHLIVRWLIDQIDRLTGVDPSDDSETLALLEESAEDAKCRLSTLGQVKFELPIPGVGLWTTTLTRDAFEEMISPQLEWLASPCSKCLLGAGLSRKGVDSLLAVGGATRAPSVLKALGEAIGQEPTFVVNPDEAACLRAAISAAIYDGELLDRVVLDVTHHSLGIDYPPGSFAPILPRNSKLPAKASRLFMTTESRFALDLLEGEREQSSANHSLARLVWDLPFRREETPVEVTLAVDITGALEVTAVDGASQTERKVPVSNEPSLKESAIKRYRAEVESYFETHYSRRSSGKSATSLSPYEKMVAAGRGSREARLALVRDDDEAVRAAVLASPKMTNEDAETMARRTDTLPSALNAIGKYREWSRSYDVVRALAFNPATPAETAMKLMDRLSAKDLDALLETKDLPRALRSQARAIKKMRS